MRLIPSLLLISVSISAAVAQEPRPTRASAAGAGQSAGRRAAAEPMKAQNPERKVELNVDSNDGSLSFSSLTKGVGNFIRDFKATPGQNVDRHESHFFSSTVDVVLKRPAISDEILAEAPPTQAPVITLPSELDTWQKDLAKWKQSFLEFQLHEEFPINVPVDGLNPCGLAGDGIPLTLNEEHYLQDVFEQGTSFLLDRATFVDPATGEQWTGPRKAPGQKGESLRLLVQPRGNRLTFKVGYGRDLTQFVGDSTAWQKSSSSATSYRVTKSLRQPVAGYVSVYPEGYFRKQRADSFFPSGWTSATNDLEAVTAVSTMQDMAFTNPEGKPKRVSFGISMLVVSHSLRALKIVLPIPHYHEYKLINASRFKRTFSKIPFFQKDHLLLGEEIAESDLPNVEKAKRILVIYESKVLCLKSGDFNPAFTKLP